MLKKIKLINTGPIPNLDLEFSPRLNLLTGDNGLGKSFLLDIAWWALTRKWPHDVNPDLTSGYMARPTESKKKAEIIFSVKGKTRDVNDVNVSFNNDRQAWSFPVAKPTLPGLILYAQSDGGFAVWDPARNYSDREGSGENDRRPAYVFSPKEIWDGLKGKDGKPLCNGLIADWAGWQKEDGPAFAHLCAVLGALSPAKEETIAPGKLTRVSLDDARDIPTLKMPYGVEVPVLHASAGMKRIISLAYVLVWAWEEHVKASEFLGRESTSQIVFLIDEIEAHLHPKWQREIVGALLSVVKNLKKNVKVQLISATHSPLVMASLEPIFDPEKDAWFDFDFVNGGKAPVIELHKRDFEKHGDVTNWLTSEAFDLGSGRSSEAEALLKEASALINDSKTTPAKVEKTLQKLLAALGPKDPFLFRWRAICEKKGWLA
jgi:hypothetical protein